MLKFKHKPILIGGGAMEYYKLRKSGHDTDYIVHPEDYKELVAKHGTFEFPMATPGVKIEGRRETDFFLNLYGYDYAYFEKSAMRSRTMLVISKKDLLMIKSMTAFDPSSGPQRVVTKSMKDMKLITLSMISRE